VEKPSPGWYLDPDANRGWRWWKGPWRWWDGQSWTGWTTTVRLSPAPSEGPRITVEHQICGRRAVVREYKGAQLSAHSGPIVVRL
jgi:hypothetical protein